MSGLPLSTSVFLAGALMAIVLVIGIYWRGRRGRTQVLPSLLILRQMGIAGSIRRPPYRWWSSLLLALCVLALLLVANSPNTLFQQTVSENWLIVIDTSLSMHTRTVAGPTRADLAKAMAVARLSDAPARTLVTIVDTTGQFRPLSKISVENAIAKIGGLVSTPLPTPASVPLLLTHTAINSASNQQRIMVFTDGVAQLALPQGAEIVSVFEPADNVAALSLTVESSSEPPYQDRATLRVVNASLTDKSVEIALTGGGRTQSQRIRLPASAEQALMFDVSSMPSGLLVASVVTDGDALSIDDTAVSLITRKVPIRILLVTRGNPDLRMAFELLPSVSLRIVDPNRFMREGVGDADIVVLDSVAVTVPSHIPVLVFGIPDEARPLAVSGAAAVRRASEPLANTIVWGDVNLRRTTDRRTGPDTVVVLANDERVALIDVHEETSHTAARIVVGFSLQDATLATQVRFPVFLAAAVARLLAQRTPEMHAPGVIAAGILPVTVHREPDRKMIPVFGQPSDAVFLADRPGAYHIQSGALTRTIVVGQNNPDNSLVNRSGLPVVASTSTSRPITLISTTEPAWTWRASCLCAAMGLLLIEAMTFTRRRTE